MRRAIAPVGVAVVLVAAAVIQWRSMPGGTGQSLPPGDRLVVVGYDGRVQGAVTPGADVLVEVLRDGTVRASADGHADARGAYDIAAGYDSGHAPGIHNGDVVRVLDRTTGAQIEQPVQVAGFLDEQTGALDGIARPGASLAITLFTTGGHNEPRGATHAMAGPDGSFHVDLGGALGERPAPSPDWPLWRGYHVDIEARDPGAGDRAVIREIQTVNTTLVSTRNHAGGGYFVPGDQVTFALWRGGTLLETQDAVADGDGIPQAVFATDVVTGDVMITSFHDAAGREQTQTLDPFNLSAVVDLSAGTVTGTTAPDAPVVAHYHGPGGQVSEAGFAGRDGRYELQFDGLTGDRPVEVFRIAEPGFTGVGAQQIELRTPAISLDDLAGKVTGYAAPVVEGFTATLQRAGATVVTSTGTTSKEGAFATSFPVEVRPGDTITVRTDTQELEPFAVGAAELTASWQGPAGPGMLGTGEPGRTVTVTIGAAPACTVTAVVGSDATWAAALPCEVHPTDPVYVQERNSQGPSSGSSRRHGQVLTAPLVRLVSPAEVAVTGRTITLVAESTDPDDGSNPSRVEFLVDQLVVLASGSPYTATVTLPAGVHAIRAVAYDAGGRVDSTGAPVVTISRARQIVVR